MENEDIINPKDLEIVKEEIILKFTSGDSIWNLSCDYGCTKEVIENIIRNYIKELHDRINILFI